jgi:hypothetical protein
MSPAVVTGIPPSIEGAGDLSPNPEGQHEGAERKGKGQAKWVAVVMKGAGHGGSRHGGSG